MSNSLYFGMRAFLFLFVFLFVLALTVEPILAQTAAEKNQPMWNGVFTAAQAERGRAVVAAHCTQCHGANRSLSDDLFMLHWEGHDLARLLQKIRAMPPQPVTTISDLDRLDVLAYLLQQNGFPAGANELSQDAAVLATLRILPREGPRPMRSGAVVQLMACLAQGPGDSWQLTSGTEPEATVLSDERESDRQAAMAVPLGDRTFQLLSLFPSPVAYLGHKVRVKGLLIRNPSGDRINVISLESAAPACGN